MCSDLMKRLQLPWFLFFSEIPPGYHISSLYFIFSLECLLCALFGSIFLLHTMLSIILFFQLFLKSDLDFGKSKILYWKIITSLIALNHRSSCWILVLSCHWRGGGAGGGGKKVILQTSILFYNKYWTEIVVGFLRCQVRDIWKYSFSAFET